MTPPEMRFDVPLGPLTTLGVGGPGWAMAEAARADRAWALVDWAQQRGRPVSVLGGGSNLLVSDAGYDGLLLQLTDQGVRFESDGAHVRVTAGAGVSWDGLVAECVKRNLAGIECLSGIPGQVGAAPIQNIGAYGQELGDTLVSVQALDRHTGRLEAIDKAACDLSYRHSRFKRHRDQHIVTQVTLRLVTDGRPELRYPELLRSIPDGASDLGAVREAVLKLRRGKSMVLDPQDPNTRSAGSFFTNPIVPPDVARAVQTAAGKAGQPAPPAFVLSADEVKLSAAWLIEHAGFSKGYKLGAAGLSANHCLALINRGGATAADLLALALEIRAGVQQAFSVTLVPEPVFLGFEASVDALLSP